MAGKISDAENLKVGNKINSNMINVSSSKSILSYQNGSALILENRKETAGEGMPGDGNSEGIIMPQKPFSEDRNLKNECLDLLRKKLISDLSLTVFSPDLENKLVKMEPIEISKERQSVIQKLLLQINQLSDAEKLLLYLKLPSSTSSPFDPLRQPLNPLGNRQEIQQTIVWIKTHLEEDSEISIPKQDVYDQYLKYCENVSMKPLSTADFGKVMKQVYPGVRPRRLGTRGNSRYCYSGMRNTCKLPTPLLPQSSAESSASNGSLSDGPSSAVETTKYKKLDRAKRRLKQGTCRIENCTTSNRYYSEFEGESDFNVKSVKRPKVENIEIKVTDSQKVENKKPEKTRENGEQLKEEVDLNGIKCEESSENSFNTFEIECEMDNDFGIYLKNVEKVAENSPSRSSIMCESSSGVQKDDNKSEFQKILFSSSDSSQILISDQNNKSCSEKNLFSLINSNQTVNPDSVNVHIKNKISGLDGLKRSVPDQPKQAKGRARKSSSFSKPIKNPRKCYVPIQPKPVDIHSFNVGFEKPVDIKQFSSDHKLGSERLPLCEESDSQEPEEEIIRYFKHLDENQVNGENLVDQAVKSIDNITVQNISLPHIISKNSTCYQKNDNLINHANQQILRSQSCFEVQRQLFNLSDNREPVQMPRSQSSVGLPTATEPTHPEAIDSDFGAAGKNKKISHLRILLEKSISTSNKIPYSSLGENSNVLSSGDPVISTAQNTESVSQALSNESNCATQVEPDSLKLNGLKILSSGPSYMPQSPNNRTKYFSFTPISPGPQSPLKTPSTPSASPFVSPRNTPLPRVRQNSCADFFLSPSERKSTSFRINCAKSEFTNEGDFNFSKTQLENPKVEKSKQPFYLQACRPRSFSSTNFCRSKMRRNSSKFIGYNCSMNPAPNRVQAVAQTNFSVNSQFFIHKNFLSSECLSNEVKKFLESNSMMTEDRSATIRSQSVPLNRMISESTWMPTQVYAPYSSYFNSENTKPTIASVSGKFLEWSSNSGTNSPEDITTNVSPFLTNGEMTSMESASLSNEVFSENTTIEQLDQYFSGDFRSGDEENFRKNDSFHEESAFSNKLELNSNGAFGSPFSESDPVIPDNIKSYLPDFEGLENKNLDDAEVERNDRKLIKTPPYEGKNDNVKDPVITSFKPVITNEISSCPGSPVLSFFGNKMSEDNQQLIEFFNFEG